MAKKRPRLTRKRGWSLGQKLWKEFMEGRVYECIITHPSRYVYGAQIGKDVFVDPRTSVLTVLLHELLHRLQPNWSEARVHRESKHALACMSEEEKTDWWLAYEMLKRNHKSVKLKKGD